MFGNVLVLGSFPDPDLSCCYQIMQLEVWKSTKPPQNYAVFTTSPMRPPCLESLPSPYNYISHTWLLLQGRHASSQIRPVQMPVLPGLNLHRGLNKPSVGQSNHPSLLFLLLQSVRRTGLPFPFVLLLIPWLLIPLRSGLQAFDGSWLLLGGFQSCLIQTDFSFSLRADSKVLLECSCSNAMVLYMQFFNVKAAPNIFASSNSNVEKVDSKAGCKLPLVRALRSLTDKN